MSRTYSKLKNKHQRRSKVHSQQYLYNASEPHQNNLNGMAADFEDELLDDIELMRQDFRYRAQRMRSR